MRRFFSFSELSSENDSGKKVLPSDQPRVSSRKPRINFFSVWSNTLASNSTALLLFRLNRESSNISTLTLSADVRIETESLIILWLFLFSLMIPFVKHIYLPLLPYLRQPQCKDTVFIADTGGMSQYARHISYQHKRPGVFEQITSPLSSSRSTSATSVSSSLCFLGCNTMVQFLLRQAFYSLSTAYPPALKKDASIPSSGHFVFPDFP